MSKNEHFFLSYLRELVGPSESADKRWEKQKHRFEFQKGSILYPPTEDEILQKVYNFFWLYAVYVKS